MKIKIENKQLVNFLMSFLAVSGLLILSLVSGAAFASLSIPYAVISLLGVVLTAAEAGKIALTLTRSNGLFALCLCILITFCPTLPCYSYISGADAYRTFLPFGLFCSGALLLNEKTKWLSGLICVFFSFSFLFASSDYIRPVYSKRLLYVPILIVLLLIFTFVNSTSKNSVVCFTVTSVISAVGLFAGLFSKSAAENAYTHITSQLLENAAKLIPCFVFIVLFVAEFLKSKDKKLLRIWLDISLISLIAAVINYSLFLTDGLMIIITAQLAFMYFVTAEDKNGTCEKMSRQISAHPSVYCILLIANAVFICRNVFA